MKAAHDASMPLLWRLGKMSLPSMAAASAVVGYAAYRGTGSKVGGGAAGIVSLVALVANQIKQNGWGIRF